MLIIFICKEKYYFIKLKFYIIDRKILKEFYNYFFLKNIPNMTKIKIFLNGDLTEINKDLNISQLLAIIDLEATKIAIEKDLEIIHPQNFDKIILEENCKIEIVHFIGGG